jgi:hypothetical protein
VLTGTSPPQNNKPRQGFTSFDQAVIQDMDEVVWRMVAIRRVPDPALAQVSKPDPLVKA